MISHLFFAVFALGLSVVVGLYTGLNEDHGLKSTTLCISRIRSQHKTLRWIME